MFILIIAYRIALLGLLPVLYLLGWYYRSTQDVLDSIGEVFPSLEKAMKKGEKDAKA